MELLECGHAESPHSDITRGYGTDKDGKRYCYACCEARDREHMREHGEITGYLSGDGKHITNWPGSVLLTVIKEWETSAGGFCRRSSITRVWARDADGMLWHGRGPGREMYIRLHRSKDARRQVA